MNDEIDLGIENLSRVTEIGRGGFSVVYAATNTLLSTRVAVKVLGRLSSDGDRRRFERECQVMGRLSHHPSVVTVHHAGYTGGGSPYLVMELVEGGSLADRLAGGSLPWTTALDLVIPIADALSYVHQAGVLHRDVKPENILLGDGGRPLLTDFGIARLGDATNTATGIAASWLHAPPETFDNKREPRSDLYSLASTLHQVISGQPPFWRDGEDTLNPLMFRLLNEPPPRLPPELAPAPLADLVVEALAKSPEDRPADLGVFADRLRALRPDPGDGASGPGAATEVAASGIGAIAYTPAGATPSFQPDARAAAADAPQWFDGAGGARSTDPTADTVSATPPSAPAPATAPPTTGRPRSSAPLVIALAATVLAVLGLLYVATRGGDPDQGAATSTSATEPDGQAPSTAGSDTGDTSTSTTSPPVSGGGAAPGADGRLALVQERGLLRCGVNQAFPGFGELLADGSYAGFDIDFCRVIAAAVLGDAGAVEFVPLTAAERFTALEVGDIDVLSRNTSQTATRSGEFGIDFPFTTFFDGQGFMARADAGIASIDDLDGARVCVLAGTTTELQLTSELSARGLAVEPVLFEDNTVVSTAYAEGQCDAWTSDVTVLSSFRGLLLTPDDHVILPELITNEPLSIGVAGGDDAWSTAVEWAVMVTVQAWEAGIDSTNIDAYNGSDPAALVITGQAGFDPGLGLQPDYPRLVVSQVGNYEEIHRRNLGDRGLVLDGSANDLVANGGRMFAPPLR